MEIRQDIEKYELIQSGIIDRGGQTHKGCSACLTQNYGEIHVYLQAHLVLQFHIQGDTPDPKQVPGSSCACSQHRRYLQCTIHCLQEGRSGSPFDIGP